MGGRVGVGVEVGGYMKVGGVGVCLSENLLRLGQNIWL